MNTRNILNFISRLPNFVTSFFIKINLYPRLIFGNEYQIKRNNFFRKQDDATFLEFVNSMVSTIEFYKRKYPNIQIKSIAEFKTTIETITKNTVLENSKLLESSVEIKCDSCTTGGTSGKPLKILISKSRYANELGSLHALWSRIGYRFSTRAVVRNERILDREYIINPITKEFIFDGFRNEPNYLSTIASVMRKHNIGYFHGYTSNAERFANHLLHNELDHSFLKGIITSSENFYEHQRTTFKKLKNVQHLNFYGHSEKLILGGWCEGGGCYHFYNSYGFTELLDEAGQDVCEIGEIGELVGSTNYNRCMPLFRYRTGDFATKAPNHCLSCGFDGLSAYKITGRWNGERIFNKDGTFVSSTALNLHNEIYEAIDGLQYYQSEAGLLEIRVIPGTTYSDHIENSLIDCIKNKLGPESGVTVRRVEELQRMKNGKYLLVISDIPN